MIVFVCVLQKRVRLAVHEENACEEERGRETQLASRSFRPQCRNNTCGDEGRKADSLQCIQVQRTIQSD